MKSKISVYARLKPKKSGHSKTCYEISEEVDKSAKKAKTLKKISLSNVSKDQKTLNSNEKIKSKLKKALNKRIQFQVQ